MLHLYMGAAMSSGEACATLVRRALENFELPYLTVTPTFSVCPQHGYLSGEHPQCPSCSADTEVWTRVMGYFRPTSSFNTGKRGEFSERTYFREAETGLSGTMVGGAEPANVGQVREFSPSAVGARPNA